MSHILNSLSKSVHRPRATGVLALRYELPDRATRWRRRRRENARLRRIGSRGNDERFSDYFASGFGMDRGYRGDRAIERNKLVVLTLFGTLVLFGLVYRLVCQ